ncbi:DUF4124 domain-containing protein, partial [Rudaea sp.]|uniref:DUF4124 domain-containing protein n=1 Tax=Rudaea sp. TaxID=2136325 RepID=UPI002ED0FF59
MKIAVLVFAGLLSLLHGAAQAQTVYKSTGPGGTVVYSDRPPVNGKIEQTINFENLPSSPLPAAATEQIERAARQVPPQPPHRQYVAGVT